MACCVIGFDAYFLNHPLQCWFSDDCNNYNRTSAYYYYYYSYSSYYRISDNFYSIKIPLVKGQLAAGALMLASCIIYIIIFIITVYRVSEELQNYRNRSAPVSAVTVTTGHVSMPMNNISHETPVLPNNPSIINPPIPFKQMTCPNCHKQFQIGVQSQ